MATGIECATVRQDWTGLDWGLPFLGDWRTCGWRNGNGAVSELDGQLKRTVEFWTGTLGMEEEEAEEAIWEGALFSIYFFIFQRVSGIGVECQLFFCFLSYSCFVGKRFFVCSCF
jgi:hypothetical protein